MGGRGSGRKSGSVEVLGFREFCRDVISDPEIQAKIREAAKGNPEFALRVAEHGFGRPPQALDVRQSIVGPEEREVYRATFDDGSPVEAENPGIPTPAPVLVPEEAAK